MMKKTAFTLVELIVVITILAILATIGFVSFSGYLAGTRDTNRIAQLKSMSDALELYRTKKDLPIPDDKVDVQAGTTTIAYQGYIGSNVLETIEYTEKGLDPKDKTYFSYYLTKNKKYFQLLSFLEEANEDVLVNNTNSISMKEGGIVTSTQAADYSDRYPKVTGKKLGILTDIENTPIQEIATIRESGYLDIIATNDTFNTHLSDEGILSGTGLVLYRLEEVANMGGKGFFIQGTNIVSREILREGLIVELLLDGNVQDSSGNGNDGVMYGNPTFTKGMNGNAILLDGVDDYVDLVNSASIQNQKDSFAWSFWFKTGDQVTTHSRLATFGDTIVSLGTYGTHQLRSWINTGSRSTEIQKGPMNDNLWHHLIFQWNGSVVELYIDNIKIGETSKTGTLENYTTSKVTLGRYTGTYVLKGLIDNFRIYNSELSESNIIDLYNEGRF